MFPSMDNFSGPLIIGYLLVFVGVVTVESLFPFVVSLAFTRTPESHGFGKSVENLYVSRVRIYRRRSFLLYVVGLLLTIFLRSFVIEEVLYRSIPVDHVSFEHTWESSLVAWGVFFNIGVFIYRPRIRSIAKRENA